MAKNSHCCDCDVIHHHTVEQVRSRMPDGDAVEAISQLYKIMGDPTRCRLLFALREQELCVCDLSNLMDMTKSSISHQLSKLRQCGVVRCRRQGKEVYYALDDAHVMELLTTALVHIGHKKEEADHENG